MKKNDATPVKAGPKSCFVLMPISDPEEYPSGHFNSIYQQIFREACNLAGFEPVRADEVSQTNLIQLDILQRLVDAPMVLCDLTSHNPNTLFELGIRQAFDKPVVLVQEVGTKPIFDIGPLRYTEYRRALLYEQVREDQRKIADAILRTEEEFQSGIGVNSIVKLLSLTRSAELKTSHEDPLLQLLVADMSSIRQEFREGLERLKIIFERTEGAGMLSERLANLPSLRVHNAKFGRNTGSEHSRPKSGPVKKDEDDIPF